jgi:hypothetical protein
LLLAFAVTKWRRLSHESLEGVARLCQENSSFTESVSALSKFYEECEAEYAVLLDERIQPIKSIRLTWGTRPDGIRCQMHLKQAGGFVEETEVEENSTPVARRENQHGVKRSFQAFEKGGGDQEGCGSDTARLEQREIMFQSGSVMAQTPTSSEAPIDNSRASNHDQESAARVNPEDEEDQIQEDPRFQWFGHTPGIDPSFSFDFERLDTDPAFSFNFEGIDADPAFTTNDLWR